MDKIPIASDLYTSSKIFRKLIEENDDEIKKIIAQNTNVPVDVLKKLAKENNVEIKIAIAKNPITPRKLLKYLIFWRNVQELQLAISNHPNTPKELIARLTRSKWKNVRENAKTKFIEINEK